MYLVYFINVFLYSLPLPPSLPSFPTPPAFPIFSLYPFSPSPLSPFLPPQEVVEVNDDEGKDEGYTHIVTNPSPSGLKQ